MLKNEITTKRFCIPYRIYGKGGPHLVCLNGIQQSMAMWRSFIKRFANEYKIVVFDFPGQGRGKFLSGPNHASIDEQVNILKQIIEISKVENITICSASWGGVVALAYAKRYPETIHRMLLGGMGTRPNTSMIEIIEKGCRMDLNNREEMAEVLIKSFGTNLPKNMKNKISRQFKFMDTKQLRGFYEQGAFVLSVKNLEEVVNLKQIQTETILLRAENDTITDLEDVKSLALKLPNGRFKIVKNVGHFLHLESDHVLEDYYSFLPKANNLEAHHKKTSEELSIA